MYLRNPKANLLLAAICIIVTPIPSYAVVFFEMDFESFNITTATNPSPIWSLPSRFTSFYGPNNSFEITDTTSAHGSQSLKFDYNGRNGYCNTCGTYLTSQAQGSNNLNYFVANSGEDLTLSTNRGPSAKSGRLVYNQTNGMSKWEVLAVTNSSSGNTNDKLTLRLLREGIDGSSPGFNSLDEVFIARQCGVDGHVAGNIDRRNDCNGMISWFDNFTSPQQHGESIFRRVYLKAELTSIDPVARTGIHQKLGYWRLPEISNYFPNGSDLSKDNIILLADSFKGAALKPQVSGLNTYGGIGSYRPDLEFERGVWYYIEQEFKAESTPGAADGMYQLWFSKAGEEVNSPALSITGLTLPPVSEASFWGNVQHTSHSYGIWYIDDIIISDSRIGYSLDPVRASPLPPKSPGIN